MFRHNGKSCGQRGHSGNLYPDEITLDKLPVGRTARVLTLEGGHVFRERVSSMGLRPGAKVEILRRGRATPLLVAVGHARLALGHGMSGKIVVREEHQRAQER